MTYDMIIMAYKVQMQLSNRPVRWETGVIAQDFNQLQ